MFCVFYSLFCMCIFFYLISLISKIGKEIFSNKFIFSAWIYSIKITLIIYVIIILSFNSKNKNTILIVKKLILFYCTTWMAYSSQMDWLFLLKTQKVKNYLKKNGIKPNSRATLDARDRKIRSQIWTMCTYGLTEMVAKII